MKLKCLDEEQQHCGDGVVESNTDDEESEEELDRKDILNSSNLDESLVMIKSLLHLTSSCKRMTHQICLRKFIINSHN